MHSNQLYHAWRWKLFSANFSAGTHTIALNAFNTRKQNDMQKEDSKQKQKWKKMSCIYQTENESNVENAPNGSEKENENKIMTNFEMVLIVFFSLGQTFSNENWYFCPSGQFEPKNRWKSVFLPHTAFRWGGWYRSCLLIYEFITEAP